MISEKEEIKDFFRQKVYNLSSNYIEGGTWRAGRRIEYEDEDFIIFMYQDSSEIRVANKYDKTGERYIGMDELPKHIKKEVAKHEL